MVNGVCARVRVCRTSKELTPMDDEIVIRMKAVIETDVTVTGSVIRRLLLCC